MTSTSSPGRTTRPRPSGPPKPRPRRWASGWRSPTRWRRGGRNAGLIRLSAETGLPEPFDAFKIDFVEDISDLREVQTIEGYRVYTLPAIYYRKLRIACGGSTADGTGRMRGGRRQVARDLVDLYYISVRFRPLSLFVTDCERAGRFSPDDIDRIHAWLRRFPRQGFIEEYLDLDLPERLDPKAILRHLDGEADALVEGRMGGDCA